MTAAAPFLAAARIAVTMPCLALPEKIRFIALTESDISAVFPYLNAVLDGAVYNPEGPSLVFNREHRRLTLFPTQITGAKVDDRADAERTLAAVCDRINATWTNRETITPDYERRNQLGVLEVVKLLPGTNCRECGVPTCFAFAPRVVSRQAHLNACRGYATPELEEKRKLLVALLQSAGYPAPEY